MRSPIRNNPDPGMFRPQRLISAVDKGLEAPRQITAKTSGDLVLALYDYIGKGSSESMIVLHADLGGRLIGYQELTMSHPAKVDFSWHGIIKEAMLKNATAIAMAHNHPSGNAQPSTGDLNCLQGALKLLEILDMVLIDFLVLGDSRYWSAMDAQKGGSGFTNYARLKIMSTRTP